MAKVRSECVWGQSDAKEVTAKLLEWLFVNIVFQRMDSGDVKILSRAKEKNVAQIICFH